MLPAFGDVRAAFGLPADSAATARLITFFFLGFAGQIFFGPISDRFGRLPIMRTGFTLYAIGSLGAAFAPSLGAILLARFVWGLGAGALQVSAMAMIRDRFVGDRMARVLSLFLVVFLVVPVFAPALGAILLGMTSWRGVFLGPMAGAIVVSIWSLRLAESHPASRRSPAISLGSIAVSARAMFTNSVTARAIAAQALTFAAFSSYLASSERIIGEIYGREELFVFIFGGTSVGMAALSLLNARAVPRLGARRTARLILAVTAVAAGAVLAVALTTDGVPGLAVYVVGLSFVVALNAMVSPNFGAIALEPQGDQAGMATAVYGAAQVALGASAGAVIDGLIDDTVTPLVAAFLVAAVLGLVLLAPPDEARSR